MVSAKSSVIFYFTFSLLPRQCSLLSLLGVFPIHVNLSIFIGKHLLSVPSSQNWKAFPFLSALPKVDSDPFHVLSLSEILKEIYKTFPTTKFFGKKK